MTASINTSSSLLDLGLIAALTMFAVVIVNADSLVPALAGLLLFVLTVAITWIGARREAAKVTRLDEMELAAASFGARWGIAAVIFIALLVTFFAPLQDGIVAIVDVPNVRENPPVPLPAVVFAAGLVTAMLIQLSAAFVIARVWTWTKR